MAWRLLKAELTALFAVGFSISRLLPPDAPHSLALGRSADAYFASSIAQQLLGLRFLLLILLGLSFTLRIESV
ncbi:hypothetical protein ACMHYB_16990 [Sorangium sp. So ce1128]